MKNDNLENLERALLVTLPDDRIPDEAEVEHLVEKFRKIFPISDDERDALIHNYRLNVSYVAFA